MRPSRQPCCGRRSWRRRRSSRSSQPLPKSCARFRFRRQLSGRVWGLKNTRDSVFVGVTVTRTPQRDYLRPFPSSRAKRSDPAAPHGKQVKVRLRGPRKAWKRRRRRNRWDGFAALAMKACGSAPSISRASSSLSPSCRANGHALILRPASGRSLTSGSMSDIFQEVDEEVRRDKAVEFWTKNQNLIVAVAVVIVLATAGYRYYEYRRLQASEAAGAAFQQALELDRDGKAEEARAALAKVAADAPGGYQALARFAQAALTAKTDPKAGAEAYFALAGDASLDPLFKDAARLREALARLDAGEADAAKSELETLATPTGVFRNTARLTLGAIAIQAKDYATAGKWLDLVVADPEAPSAERKSAESLLGVVASNAPAPK